MAKSTPVNANVFAALWHTENTHAHSTCCWCKAPLVSILNDSVWRCPDPDCFARCLKHSIAIPTKRGGVEYLFVPLPIQCVFIEAVLRQEYRYILFGGAAGVSKSHALRWLGHYLCLKYPNFRVLLLRRTFGELEKSHLPLLEAEAIKLGVDYKSTERVVKYHNASRFEFGHCADKGDEQKYLSAEYDLILFDELTTFEESQIVMISSRARNTRKDWIPMVAAGTNPYGMSAQYCLTHFVNKNPDPRKYPRYKPNLYLYVAGTMDDNPYLNENYEEMLESFGPELFRGYRYGDWNIFPGQFFKEWCTHDTKDANGCVVYAHTHEMLVPKFINRFCSIDWGYAEPGVCLWWACLQDGKLYIEDEYVFQETIAQDVAQEIKRRNTIRGISVRYYAADPSMWQRSGQTGESYADTFRMNGVPLRKAENTRTIGWGRVRALLRLDKDSVPFLRVSRLNCPYLCRTMPMQLTLDQNREDLNTDGEDHAVDAVRYGAMSRPQPTRDRITPLEAVKGCGGELRFLAAQ